METPLYDIAKRIADAAGVACTSDDDGAYYTRMRADWTRASRVLGWKPTVSLEGGLGRTISEAKEPAIRP